MQIRKEKRNLKIDGNNYEYTLRRRRRVRHIRLSIDRDGSLTVTMPAAYPIFLLKRFLTSRYQWIVSNLAKVKNNPSILGIKHSKAEINKYKKQTRLLVMERLRYFNQFYSFAYNRVSIRNQKSRWGSCSSDKNLNFNYRLALLPSELADYIIVHELCHLKEMNHSPSFWYLVEKTIPDYKELTKKLKNI